MYKRLTNNYPNLPVELYACYGGHGIFNNDPEKDKRSLYRIQKAICFFNRIRSGDKTQTYIQINKNEYKIPYQELDLISPVNCSYTPMSDDYVINTSVSNCVEPTTAISIRAPSRATLFIKSRSSEMNITISDIDGKMSWSRQNVWEKIFRFR
jgi:hypothetical protein